jgi:hypothetical protein
MAHSLSEALADLDANEGIEDGPHLVRDAFLETSAGEEDPVLHVEVVSLPRLLAEIP